MAIKATSFRLDGETLEMIGDIAGELSARRDGAWVSQAEAIRVAVKDWHRNKVRYSKSKRVSR